MTKRTQTGDAPRVPSAVAQKLGTTIDQIRALRDVLGSAQSIGLLTEPTTREAERALDRVINELEQSRQTL